MEDLKKIPSLSLTVASTASLEFTKAADVALTAALAGSSSHFAVLTGLLVALHLVVLAVAAAAAFLEAAVAATAADVLLLAVVAEEAEDLLENAEQWHVEKPLKKQTEHWIAIAPSDLRSNVADCCRIMAMLMFLTGQHCAHN